MLEEASPAPSYSIAPSSALMLTRFSRRSSAGITLDVPLYDILPQSRSGTSQLNELLKDDNEFAAIVVVDECDRDARAEVWNKLRNRGPRIRLVIVHSEPEETADAVYTSPRTREESDRPTVSKDPPRRIHALPNTEASIHKALGQRATGRTQCERGLEATERATSIAPHPGRRAPVVPGRGVLSQRVLPLGAASFPRSSVGSIIQPAPRAAPGPRSRAGTRSEACQPGPGAARTARDRSRAAAAGTPPSGAARSAHL